MYERLISSIRVDELFARHSYSLHVRPYLDSGVPRLLALYGDNGAGKTTILTLLFRLLSPADKRGHKTYVSQVPFTRFEVRFLDGTCVVASRDEPVTGPYRVEVSEAGGSTRSFRVLLRDGEGVVPGEVDDLLLVLRSLEIPMLSLTDDRRFRDDFHLSDTDYSPAERVRLRDVDEYVTYRQREQVAGALEAAAESIRDRVFEASNRWQATEENIYLALIRRLARASGEHEQVQVTKKATLQKTLRNLQAESRKFAQIGLAAELVSDDFLELVASADDKLYPSIAHILQTYITNLGKRLKELKPSYEISRALVDALNGFLRGKRISFSVSTGFRVIADDGASLDVDRLSSGERHLLLLFCRVVTAMSPPSILLIDEPELSLNIKWQRILLEQLLVVTKTSPVQFIIATHCVPMLSGYTDYVCRLGEVQSNE